jgi:hypothetical protein
MTTSPIFTKTLVHGRHVRSFRIHPMPATGWMASQQADQRVVLRRQYTDWHRVERILTRFMGEVAELRRAGWVDA